MELPLRGRLTSSDSRLLTLRMSPDALWVRHMPASDDEELLCAKPSRPVLRFAARFCARLSLVLRQRGTPNPHSPSDTLPERSLERLREGVL